MRKPNLQLEGVPNWLAPAFIGLEIAMYDGKTVFHSAVVQRRNKTLHIQKWVLHATDLSTALAGLDRNDPLYVVYTGKPVILKPIASVGTEEWHPPATQFLPGVEANAFSTLLWEPGSVGQQVALLRNTVAESWEKEISLAGFAVHGFVIGPFFSRLLGLNGRMGTQTGNIVFNAMGTDWEPTTDPENLTVNIGEKVVDSLAVPSIAVAMAGAMKMQGILAPVSNAEVIPVVQSARLLKKIAWMGGLAGLLFMTSSAAARFYFHKQEGNLHQIKQRFDSRARILDSLQQLQRQQNKLQQDLLLGGPSYLSYFTDRMVQSMPDGVAMESLELFPSKEKKKRASEKDPQRFEHDLIIVSGTTKSNQAYQEWVKSLKAMDWVSAVENLEYQDVQAVSAGFKIAIRTRS
jgi:hypothetical protein